jgi:hypothetical protein
VLPALVGQDYAGLEVAGGQEAMDSYLRAIQPDAGADLREEVRRQLLEYCGLDTKGLLFLWREFADRKDLAL